MAKPKQTQAKAAKAAAPIPRGDESGTDKPTKTRKRGGDRPSTFTAEIGAEICERLAGGETLDAICRDPHMPATRVTVFRWRKANRAFDDAYRSARVDQMEALADEVLEIAATETDIQRARVKLDARRILLGKFAATYGLERHPEEQPVSIAEALEETRKKLAALAKELGQASFKRMLEDKHIEDAINPKEGTPECMVRGAQRVAMHILEQRKKALLEGKTEGGVH